MPKHHKHHSDCNNKDELDLHTITLTRENLENFPYGDPFDVQLVIKKDKDDGGRRVTITIPSINSFLDQLEYPDQPNTPDEGFPVGGYIGTIDNYLPKKYRHNYPMPVTFFVNSVFAADKFYVGEIDFRGRLRFTGQNSLPLETGVFNTNTASVSYIIKKNENKNVDITNFPVWTGFSNAAKYSNDPKYQDPVNYNQTSIQFEFGDYNDISNAFYNNKLHAIWPDNSINLPLNKPNDPYKSYAYSNITYNCGKVNITNPINLNRVAGGSTLSQDYTYAEGAIAVDPTNENNTIVVYQQRKSTRIGFVISKSNDGGKTWNRKLIADGRDPKIPVGGTDIHLSFDKFGGLHVIYLSVDPNGNTYYFIYSADKGNTFKLYNTVKSESSTVQLDFGSMDIGGEPNNSNNQLLWFAVNQANPDQVYVYYTSVRAIRIKGLGLDNIEVINQTYDIESTVEQFPWVSVSKEGVAAIMMYQYTAPGSNFNDTGDKNTYITVRINKNGVDSTNSNFNEKRYVELTAMGYYGCPPAQPNRCISVFAAAFDKSNKHAERIYCLVNDRLDAESQSYKPLLFWSDNYGITWSAPLLLADNPKNPNNQILTTLAVDPISGNVASYWHDGRNSVDGGESVQVYGIILDQEQLV